MAEEMANTGLDFEEPILALEGKIEELQKLNADPDVQFDAEILELRNALQSVKKSVYAKLTPWQSVQVARHKDRPLLGDFIAHVFDEFIELHGDRCHGDDRALVGGFATVGEHKVMLLGFDKGRSVEDKVISNFGMAHPEGYRKALRLMKLAEKYGLPVISLIDTPAAYPGAEAEARGQAEAIARNITEMTTLETPIIVIIVGEGGSGGALGIGVGDVVMMLQNAIYSVIPPEGCAAILWRDAGRAEEAAKALKLTAKSLLKLGIIDEIIAEPDGGSHRDHEASAEAVKEALLKHLPPLKRMSTRRLLDQRFKKFAAMGKYH
jgi:acetyl-CoA carboxylase carboxyl transferase subunit alpha